MTSTANFQSDSLTSEKEAHKLSVQKVLNNIEKIASELEAEAAPSEELGKLTDKAVELIGSSGMTEAYLPKELGGMGLYPGEAMPILERVAYIDGSIGWVNTIFAAGGLLTSYLPDSVTSELLSGEDVTCFGAVSNGKGTAVLTEDGWKISGSYRYASGIKHSQYIFMPAMKVIDGKPIPPPVGLGFFLIPTPAVELAGGWDTIGLRSTGSVDFSVKDLMIPKNYELNVMAPPSKGGRATKGGVWLNIPIMHLGFALGITERILDEVKVLSNRKPPIPNATSLAEKESFRIQYARKYMEAKAARAVVKEVMDDIDETLRNGKKLSTRQESMLRSITIHAHDVTRDIANWAFKYGGGTSLREGTLNRNIRDALAGCQHFVASDVHYINVGFDLLGAPEDHGWLGLFNFGPKPPMPPQAKS